MAPQSTATNGLSRRALRDRKSTRLNSSHLVISYAVFCLKKKNVHQALLALDYGPTTFIVAHLLSTVINICHMLMLDRWQIIHSRRHDELRMTSPMYSMSI